MLHKCGWIIVDIYGILSVSALFYIKLLQILTKKHPSFYGLQFFIMILFGRSASEHFFCGWIEYPLYRRGGIFILICSLHEIFFQGNASF